MPVSSSRGLNFQQVTVSTTPLSLTLPAGVDVSRVRILVQTNAIRFRYDGGGDPTTTTGHLASASAGAVDMTKSLIVDGVANILAFRMIRDAAADAVVSYSCEG